MDVDVAKLLVYGQRAINDFQQHGAFVLVEPFCGLIDVVVCASVGTADNHDSDGGVVDAVVVDWGLEEVGVFGYPGTRCRVSEMFTIMRRMSRDCVYHFGMFNGGPSCLRADDCEKWRGEATAPEVRSSSEARRELCSRRAAGRNNRRLIVMVNFSSCALSNLKSAQKCALKCSRSL